VFLTAVAIALTDIWAANLWEIFHNEVTVYYMLCTGEQKEEQCNSKDVMATQTTYKAITEQQTVIYWHGDNDTPSRLRYCAVRDAQNWSCQLGNKLKANPTIEWQMVNGEYYEVNHEFYDRPKGIFYPVSKWHWWWVRGLAISKNLLKAIRMPDNPPGHS
jgi:hypothetical protein